MLFSCADPEQRDLPFVSKFIEMTTSTEATSVESFSELLQLPGDKKITPTHLSSSPVIPCKINTHIQATANVLLKWETIVYSAPHTSAEVTTDLSDLI